MHTMRTFLRAVLMLCTATTALWAQQKTGDVVDFNLADSVGTGEQIREKLLEVAGAGFLRIHFTQINLAPGDKLEILDGSGAVVQVFRDAALVDVWSTIIYEQPARIVLTAGPATHNPTYNVNQIVRGDPAFSEQGPCLPDCAPPKANMECVVGTPEYGNRVPVSRFHGIHPVDGPFTCTAWMIGEPDCLITNWHCVAGVPVGTMMAEFDFECTACVGGVCKPSVFFPIDGILALNPALDYALLDTAGAPGVPPPGGFGILPVNSLPPIVGTSMYEIHHGGGLKKGIDYGTYTGLFPPGAPPCNSPPVLTEVTYTAVASRGASGSPIFCDMTHRVEGICHCGFADCTPGFGIPMSAIAPGIIPVMDAHGCTYDIADVPCEMQESPVIPSVSEWGVVLLVVLVLTVGTMAIRGRRVRVSGR